MGELTKKSTLILLKNQAKGPFDPCPDVFKCGQCLKQTISAGVAKEELAKESPSWPRFEAEVKQQWQGTTVFKLYKNFRADGKTHLQAIADMEALGFQP
jgi:hypothetical protein